MHSAYRESLVVACAEVNAMYKHVQKHAHSWGTCEVWNRLYQECPTLFAINFACYMTDGTYIFLCRLHPELYIYIYTLYMTVQFFFIQLHYIYIIYPSISAWASPLRSPKSLKSSNTLAPLPELCSPCLSSHWRISVWVWQGNPLTFGARKCWDSPADTGLGDWGTGLWLRESCKKMWRTPSCRGL